MSNETSATAGDLGCCSGGRDSCLCSCISRAANVARVPVGPAHGSGRLRHWRALGPWKAMKGGLTPQMLPVDSCSVGFGRAESETDSRNNKPTKGVGCPHDLWIQSRNFRNILKNIEKDFIRQIVPWTHTHAAEGIRSI